jgi:hypothetical protein
MKKRSLFYSFVTLVALAALAVAGCAIDQGARTGAMTFAFSPAARALGTGETYRVEVYYGSDLYEAKDSLNDETIVFEALPTGQATVFVAQGSGAGDNFVASKYGSFEVTVAPGDNSPQSLTLAEVPFRTTLAGVGVASVVSMGSDVYVATSSNLLKRTAYDAGWSSLSNGPAVPEGMRDLSLNIASYFTEGGFAPQVWVNGTWSAGAGGILPWVGSSLDQSFAAGFSLGSNWSSGSVPADSAFTVLRSGSYAVSPADAEDGLAIFYQRNGGLGGVYVTRAAAGNQENWHWIMDQIDLSAALGDIVTPGQEPILDFAVSDNALYLVTSFTTLRVSKDLLDARPSDAQAVLESGYVAFATDVRAAITSIAVNGGKVFLGTNDGLWKGTAGSTDFFAADGPPARVPATTGYRVRTISVSPDGAYVAFISNRDEGADFLAVMPVDAPADLRMYRTLEGLPGRSLKSIVWLDASTLLVGGSGGLAALTVGN